MTNLERWNRTLDAVRTVVPHVRVIHKRDSRLIRFIDWLLFWVNLSEDYWQGFGRTVYAPDDVDFDDPTASNVRVLQHECTHVMDSCTLFGLTPWLPWWLNSFMYAVLYILVPPIPGIGRGFCEMRCYRRNVELRGIRESDVRAFQSYVYVWMWPMPTSWLQGKLMEPSPYGPMFDEALED